MKKTVRIDNCSHTFETLATKVLPRYMTELRRAMNRPHKLSEFSTAGRGIRGILENVAGRSSDFPGCYVFLDRGGSPFYVGISRGVITRIIQHVRGKDHYSASLVYRMAQSNASIGLRRAEAMKHEGFLVEFTASQKRLRSQAVAFVEIANDLELYLFEIYCAMKLGTGKWNTFKTH